MKNVTTKAEETQGILFAFLIFIYLTVTWKNKNYSRQTNASPFCVFNKSRVERDLTDSQQYLRMILVFFFLSREIVASGAPHTTARNVVNKREEKDTPRRFDGLSRRFAARLRRDKKK